VLSSNLAVRFAGYMYAAVLIRHLDRQDHGQRACDAFLRIVRTPAFRTLRFGPETRAIRLLRVLRDDVSAAERASARRESPAQSALTPPFS
jgi:hypothetical protein